MVLGGFYRYICMRVGGKYLRIEVKKWEFWLEGFSNCFCFLQDIGWSELYFVQFGENYLSFFVLFVKWEL